MSRRSSRRTFLQQSALAGAGFWITGVAGDVYSAPVQDRRRPGPNDRLNIRSGALGDVREVHIWTNRPIWPQGQNRPKETPEVPNGLHWDLWLGPAPRRPYNPAYVPFAWRGWWDFGTGAIGDMACHTMNMP